jgi:hypothetical protein
MAAFFPQKFMGKKQDPPKREGALLPAGVARNGILKFSREQ